MKTTVVITILHAFEQAELRDAGAVLGIAEIRERIEKHLSKNSESYLRFYLSKMVDHGYLSRVGRGLYKLAEEGDAEFDEKFQPANMPDTPIWRRVDSCDTDCQPEPTYARWMRRTAAAGHKGARHA